MRKKLLVSVFIFVIAKGRKTRAVRTKYKLISVAESIFLAGTGIPLVNAS